MCSSASSHDVCSSVSSDWNSSNRGIFFDNEESSANIHSISCTIPVWGLLETQIFSAKDKCHRMDLLAEGCFGSSPEAEHLRWNCILGSVCVQLGICILDVFLVNRRYLGGKKRKTWALKSEVLFQNGSLRGTVYYSFYAFKQQRNDERVGEWYWAKHPLPWVVLQYKMTNGFF